MTKFATFFGIISGSVTDISCRIPYLSSSLIAYFVSYPLLDSPIQNNQVISLTSQFHPIVLSIILEIFIYVI